MNDFLRPNHRRRPASALPPDLSFAPAPGQFRLPFDIRNILACAGRLARERGGPPENDLTEPGTVRAAPSWRASGPDLWEVAEGRDAKASQQEVREARLRKRPVL